MAEIWKLLVVKEGGLAFFAVTRSESRAYCARAGLELLGVVPFDLPANRWTRFAAEGLLSAWESRGAGDRASPPFVWVKRHGGMVIEIVARLALDGKIVPPSGE